MQPKLALLLGFSLGLAVAPAQPAPPPGAAPRDSDFAVAERGPHHAVWRRVIWESAPGGGRVARTNSYVELATGLNFLDGATGQWRPAREEWRVFPEAVVADAGRHSVMLARNLNVAGAVDLLAADGVRLVSNPAGIGLFDPVDGKHLLLAEIRDCQAQRGAAPNEIVFPDCFDGVRGSLRYLYTKAGFHQHYVLEERLELPAGFSDQTRVEFYTEFAPGTMQPRMREQVLAAETHPATRSQMVAPDFTDSALDFGDLKMGAGQAFMLGDATDAGRIPVGKSFGEIDGRPVLIESVEFQSLAPLAAHLSAAVGRPATGRVAGTGPRQIKRLAARARAGHEPLRAELARGAAVALAGVRLNREAVVIDYESLSSGLTNHVFQGDKTYLVSGPVYLSGTTTLESAVIKFAKNSSAQLAIVGANDTVDCRTGPFRPAILTAADDDSAGESIAGSTGNPGGPYALVALSKNFPGASDLTLQHLRIAYAGVGLALHGAASHVQFVNVDTPVSVYQGSLNLLNALMYNVTNQCFNLSAATVSAQHLTIHHASLLGFGGSYTLSVTNSLFIGVTNCAVTGTFASFFGSFNITNASDAGVFQSAAAGRHYLADDTYRNQGTTNLDATLLAALRQKTTHPPVVYASVTITNDTTFSPQALRDTDTPDLGYHYDPIDHAFGQVDAYADLTFTAGTVAAWFRTESSWYHGGYGLHLDDRQVCTFAGRVDAPCRWVRCNTVGEADNMNWYGVGGIVGWAYPAATNAPVVRARFTEFSLLGGEWTSFTRDDSGFLKVELTDCRFHGGIVGYYAQAAALTNCFFDRSQVALLGTDPEALKLTMRHCTMRGGSLALAHWEEAAPHWTASVRDCVFDGTTIYQENPADGDTNWLDFAYNAYVTGGERLLPTNVNDVVVTNFHWQVGPMGDHYLPVNSPLINAGSMTNAASVGLYHHTTTADQVKETNSAVDLGYHYLAAAVTENLALGQAASQSSTLSLGEAAHAVDGNTNGYFWDGSITHTWDDAQAWWQVDLGQVSGIGSITLWNRQDCCGERLGDFYVLVSDEPFGSTDLAASLHQAGVGSYYHAGVMAATGSFAVQRSGRYVRVQLTGTNYLQLAEVAVFASGVIPLDSDGDGVPDYLEDPNGNGIYDGTSDVSDWSDYFDGALPYLEIVSKHRHCTVSNWLALPLVIRAADSNDTALVNAPLTFAVTNGTAQFTSCTNGPMSTNLFLRTDADGLAETWLFLPTNAVTTNYITVTAISGTNQAQMQLLVWLEDPDGGFYTVAMNTNGPSIGLDSAGTMLWKNHGDMPHFGPVGCTNCQGTPTYYGSNFLWLEITDMTNQQVFLKLHNTTNGFYYQLFSTTNIVNYYSISNISGSSWKLEQTKQATNNNLVFDPVSTNGNPRMLFWARLLVDSDGQGLPDWWQFQYFGHLGVDPWADPDNDGWPNMEEFWNGTHPDQFSTPPPPRGLFAAPNPSGYNVVRWSPPPTTPVTFIIQRNTGAGWQSIATNSGSVYSFTDTAYGPNLSASYRVTANYPGGSSPAAEYNNSGIDPSLTGVAATLNGLGGRIQLLASEATNGVAALLVSSTPIQSRHPKDGIHLVNAPFTNTSFYGRTTNAILQLDVTNFSSLPLVLGTNFMPRYGYYQNTLQILGKDGRAGNPVIMDLENDATPFLDGRQHMLDNLNFITRAATAAQPFDFYFPDFGWTRLTGDGAYYGGSADYASAGFNWKWDGYSLFGQDAFDPFQPFEDGSILRAFCFVTNRFDGLGNPLDVDYGGLSDLPIMNTWSNYFSSLACAQAGNTNLPPRQLDSTNAQYIFYGPAQDGDDVPALGLTWDDTVPGWRLDSDARNYYGLKIQSVRSVKLADTTQPIIVRDVAAGGTLPAFGTNAYTGWLYFQAEYPLFQNLGFHVLAGLWNVKSPGSPFWDGHAQTNVPIISAGDQLHMAVWSQLAITNHSPNSVAYLQHYFDKAYTVGTNGVATTNETGVLSEYGSFFPTEPGPVVLVTKPDLATGQSCTSLVHVIALNVDANHDGAMDLSLIGQDHTSAGRPFRFWVNNDHDEPASGSNPDRDLNNWGHPPPVPPDYSYGAIRCPRNLEDLARLWVSGVPSLPIFSGFNVSLRWRNTNGSPAINLYESCVADGSAAYLTDTNAAALQVRQTSPGTGCNFSIGTVGNTAFTFPDGYFTSTDNQYLLFEGTNKGSGELVLTVSHGTNVLAETSAWIDLHDVKDFYERVVITNITTGAISNWSSGIQTIEYPKATMDDDTNIIVFVHGINNTVPDWLISSDTIFKRLYWSGYQGKFATVRWPCKYLPPRTHPFDFNLSEYYAYLAATGFKNYLTDLQARFSMDRLHVLAHSQGNAVASEAIRQGAPFDTYILTQGAIPANCFDTTVTNLQKLVDAEAIEPTPDLSPMGYRGIYTNLTGRIVNFYNPIDYALATGTELYGVLRVNWEENERLTKPDGLPGARNYTSDGTNGYSLLGGPPPRLVTDSRESRGMVARSRTKAVGAQAGVEGVVDVGLDLQASYGFSDTRNEHSAQFARPIQSVYPYYQQILIQIQPAQ